MATRLKEKYQETVRKQLQDKFTYKNVNQIPKLAKVVINLSVGEAITNSKALDAAIAQEMEPRFAEAGCAVVTNSSAFRMTPDVPLVIPEVNGDHIAMIDGQQWRKKSRGYIVTNPNCSAIGLVMALAPLAKFGIDKVMAVTMQDGSGAGYPGVASLDILGNVIPYIADEEPKLGRGMLKLVGQRLRQINVVTNTQKLNGLGLTSADIVNALGTQNVQIPGGKMTQEKRDLTLRTYGRVEAPDDCSRCAYA